MKKNGPGALEGKPFKGVDGRRMDGRTTTDDGWQVIIIAHAQPSAEVN